ncbi:MAG TPA: LssY C-terminal domain-containing protein [candidate division Zixibacteria bacterium]|nr:LssY C-terminal domain-containing protein [candidate division Zixibacteria bacterium]
MTIAGKRILFKCAVLLLFLAGLPGAQAQARAQTAQDKTASSKSYEFDVSAAKEWTDTNLVVREGAKLRFTATGKITYPVEQSFVGKSRTGGTFGPAGLPRGWADMIHQYAVRDAGHGALIGRVGSAEYAVPFVIGESFEYSAPVAGKLSLGLNQSEADASTATGSFHVRVEVLEQGTAETATAGGPAETRIAGITPDLLAQIPRRVSDPNNNPGDMVNVLIVGTEDQMVQAFTRAGWVKVDKTVQNTMLFALTTTLQKKDYLTMPMSTLFLFERAQDYGFAHAEPVKVAMSRHHLRVWKSPYVVDGRPLWCISATHDIGFERDQRNNGITHKIDPEIDGEREYVNGTLSETGLVAQRDHVTPADPLTTAKTATGGEFHSDGRIVVLLLKNTSSKGD